MTNLRAALYRFLRRRSLNQLLAVHMACATPFVVGAFVFHGWFAIAGYLYLALGWAVMSQLRRAAWKHQFRPRARNGEAA